MPTPSARAISTYDANGNKTALITQDGKVTRYTYDALNRLSTIVGQSGAVANSYDRSSLTTRIAYGNGTSVDAVKKTAEVVESAAQSVVSRVKGMVTQESGSLGTEGARITAKSVPAESDTRTISYFGFRGQGNPKTDLDGPNAPNPLLVTGHFGMSTDGGKKAIVGFNPDVPPDMSGGKVVRSLLEGKSYAGKLTNDRDIFVDAATRTGQARGGSPDVYKMDIQVSKEKFEEIEKFISQNLNVPMPNRPYAFPGHGGPCARNCATFPETLGLPLPENSGQIKAYIEAMQEQGKIWKPTK